MMRNWNRVFFLCAVVCACGCCGRSEELPVVIRDADGRPLIEACSISAMLDAQPDFARVIESAARTLQGTGGTIELPEGEYTLTQRIDLTVDPGRTLCVVGAGIGATDLRPDNAEGGIYCRLSDSRSRVEFRDFSLKQIRADAGVGIAVEGEISETEDLSNVLVKDLDMRLPEGVVAANWFFNKALSVRKVHRPVFDNVVISNVLGSDLPSDLYERGLLGEVGIEADSVSSPMFVDCYVWSFERGYRITNHLDRSGSPIRFTRSYAVGCKKGIELGPVSRTPVVVEDGHYNCRIFGIRLKDVRSNAEVRRNLFYNVDALGEYPDYRDVLIEHSSNIRILDNIFHAVSHVSRYGVWAVDASTDLSIARNKFTFEGTSIGIGTSCEKISIESNNYDPCVKLPVKIPE